MVIWPSSRPKGRPSRAVRAGQLLWRLSRFEYNPTHRAQAVLKVIGLAWHRSQGREVMLYVGGVSFSALMAIFPALVILLSVYSLLFTPEQAQHQAEALARLLPPGVESLFADQLTRLAHTPIRIASLQSLIAFLFALYASQKGVKALLAGLSLIHNEERPRGFFGFNILALVVALGGFALMTLVSGAFLALRVMAFTLHLTPFAFLPWIFSEWIWAFIGLALAFTFIYRWAMSSRPVAWRASAPAGVTASVLSLFSSWACAFYVQQIAHLGATYGSIATVVVFLIWLSWNVNAVFYGGALATEIEIVIGRRELKRLKVLHGAAARAGSPPES